MVFCGVVGSGDVEASARAQLLGIIKEVEGLQNTEQEMVTRLLSTTGKVHTCLSTHMQQGERHA